MEVRGHRAYRLTSDENVPDPHCPDDRVPRLGYRPPEATPHVRRYLVRNGDRLILCTDGLWRGVNERDLSLTAGLDPQAACEFLCTRSVAREETSVVVVDFSEVSATEPP